MKKKHHHQSLASHLSLWIVLSGAAVFLAVLSSNYFLSRKLLENYVEQLARETAFSTVQKVDTVLHSVAISADSLAAVVTIPEITKKHIRQMIKAFVTHNAGVFGMSVALEPGALPQPPVSFAPYYYKKDHDIAYADLSADSYAYRNRHWYTDTKQANRAIWSEPYLDKGGGNVHMVTYSVPIYFKDGKTFAGVATADIRLSWLDDIIRHSKIGKTGFGFIVSDKDIIIAHPDKSLHMKPLKDTGISSENWNKYLNSKASTSAAYFSTPCNQEGGSCWVAIKTLSSSGWKIIIVIPKQKLIAEIQLLTVKIAALAAGGLIILFLVVVYITRSLTRPLAKLTQATRDIGAGNLDIELPVPQRMDEIGSLSDDFNSMRDALRRYIADLQETTARQQKLESEIQIARDIQMSMIPGNGNALVARPSYQLFALLRPARSVGGDLYYYQQDERYVHFIIGDVSDKGVPAALFMAKTVTLYTRGLKEKLTPAQSLSMMNDVLTANNDACMFVTALCGRLDLDDGSMLMANAGHMNPLIRTGNTVTEQKVEGATALGLIEGSNYVDIAFTLPGGTSCIMYTDGISEAHNRDDEQYGETRLKNVLAAHNTEDIEKIGRLVISDVDSFAANTEQFDDITLLVIHYIGRHV